jgi:hypothetical protein
MGGGKRVIIRRRIRIERIINNKCNNKEEISIYSLWVLCKYYHKC